MSRCLAVVVGAFAVSMVGCAPTASADPSPTDGRAASTIVDELKSQGYNVQINWVNGFDTTPLSECSVTGVNNPGDMMPTEGTFTTVYVDVACPNGDDGRGGFGFGVGIG